MGAKSENCNERKENSNAGEENGTSKCKGQDPKNRLSHIYPAGYADRNHFNPSMGHG
jgi:hypothetical protein